MYDPLPCRERYQISVSHVVGINVNVGGSTVRIDLSTMLALISRRRAFKSVFSCITSKRLVTMSMSMSLLNLYDSVSIN